MIVNFASVCAAVLKQFKKFEVNPMWRIQEPKKGGAGGFGDLPGFRALMSTD